MKFQRTEQSLRQCISIASHCRKVQAVWRGGSPELVQVEARTIGAPAALPDEVQRAVTACKQCAAHGRLAEAVTIAEWLEDTCEGLQMSRTVPTLADLRRRLKEVTRDPLEAVKS